ncbi:MAG: phage head closure protein [Rhizobiaceae bacterium]|nr:phage head closure protein [Rhizobiaceae bacterium]
MALHFFDPGQLRTPMELQSCIEVPDGQGGVHKDWQTIAEIFAHVEPIGSISHLRARYKEQKVSHRVILRYRDDINLDLRFQRGSRIFAIRGIHDLDESKRYLICKCEETTRPSP